MYIGEKSVVLCPGGALGCLLGNSSRVRIEARTWCDSATVRQIKKLYSGEHLAVRIDSHLIVEYGAAVLKGVFMEVC